MIQVKDRMLCVPDEERSIGYVADNETEVRQFLVTDAAFFDFTFQLDLENRIYADVVSLEKKETEDGVLLTWTITAENLQFPGMLSAQLRASSEAGEVWHSEVTAFRVENSIFAPGVFPRIPPSEYENFKEYLTRLLEKTAAIECGDGLHSLLMVGAKSAFADYCVAVGPGCIAGRKGYYIKSIDLAAQKIYLSAEKVEAPEMADTDNTDKSFETPAYEVGDYISIINGSHYYYCATIAAIENNVITYEGDLGFTAFAEDANADGHTLYVPSKPEVGAAVFGVGGFAAGEGCKAGGRGVLTGGRDNEGANYATVGGRGNQGGYGVGLFGTFNFAPGLGSLGGGSWNEILARYCGFSGTHNKIEKTAEFSRIDGTGNTIGTAHTLGGGQGSTSRAGRMNTFHGENLDITGSFNDVEGRGHKVSGSFNFVRGDYLIAEGNQAVLGAYNLPDPDKLLVIGGGTAGERKNIFTIDRDGNVNGTNIEALQTEITALQEKAAALSDFSVSVVMEGLTEELAIAPRFGFFGTYYRVLTDGEPIDAEYIPLGENFRTAHGVLSADGITVELYNAEKTAVARCRMQTAYEGEFIRYGNLVKEA